MPDDAPGFSPRSSPSIGLPLSGGRSPDEHHHAGFHEELIMFDESRMTCETPIIGTLRKYGKPLAEVPVVYLLGDDSSLSSLLETLLPTVGLDLRLAYSADDFLRRQQYDACGCLILDVRLPLMSGLELQARLVSENRCMPVIFVTAHGDIPMAVRAMKAGAVDFLSKPIREQDLLDAIMAAIDRNRADRQQRATTQTLRARYQRLTAREQQVMSMVAAGLQNKQIAAHINRSEITVKLHRRHVMEKMEASCLADLVRVAEVLGARLMQG
jgi:FixJ family two-component response regulator